MSLLNNRRVLLGVTGGIAAYKVCTLASHLTQAGARVDVVMTEAATRFVTPLTFQSLTGRPVYTSLWGAMESDAHGGESALLPTHVVHVGLAEAAELMVIAPATANTLAKLSHGIADNLLTSLALAARCPVLVAPAMDGGMWANAATQENVATIRERGVHVVGPAIGRLASGLEGEGRMAEPEEILGHIRRAIGREGPLAGRKVVVSAGPTRESLDPVRFLSNPSSGRQGFALAQAALDRGAAVTLVAGPTELATPAGAERVDVTTAEEMGDAVIAAVEGADALLMAAAVADYRPAEAAPQKLKKTEKALHLELERTPDILSAVAVRWAGTGFPRVVVGFAAETESLLDNARRKLAAKNLDLIVANDVTSPDAGFAAETNRVMLLGRDGEAEELPLRSKAAVADAVLERVVRLLAEKPVAAKRRKAAAKKGSAGGGEG
ncbi:MAG: bifunctional phosphopantothenoylcysteine decarboxylase/phosphopantothenate--cysteine ligase CoaBC [Anaerolineales bacterium]|nr:MAG: bifunctional phosphopantothenoylcysteine decarboxylase/phosphopantothenate--cysteine ligase CoaBC [Anaerolineales bacterium]